MATDIAGAKRSVSQTRRPESADRLGLRAAASVRIAGSACLALGMVLGATQASRAATSGERALDAVITVAPASARLSAAVRDLLMSELGTGAVPRREDLIRIADGDDDDGGGNDDDDDGGGGNDDDDDGDGSPTGPDDDDDGGGRGNDDDDDGGGRGNDDDDDGGGRLSPPPRGSSDDDD